MAFYVGQKVVCVDSFDERPWIIQPAVEGRVYTVRFVYPEDKYGPTHLLLHELKNPIAGNGHENSFGFWRFRPLVERKTSIAVFEKILQSSKIEEKV